MTSNPWMWVRVQTTCGMVQPEFEQRYQDPHPEIGDPWPCDAHGPEEITRWWRRSR